MLAAAFLCLSLAIVCPDNEVEVDGKCYPKACVFEDAVCNNHGMCMDGACFCDMNYVLTELGCYPEGCSDTRTGYVCGRHGTCIQKGELYTCDCMEGYIYLGPDCIHPFCMVDYSVCSYYGDCVYDENDQPYCRCDKVASGEHCEECSDIAVKFEDRCLPSECLTERHDGTVVECGGFGICYGLPPYGDESSCMCDLGTKLVGMLCIPTACQSGKNGDIFCSNNGYCDSSSRKCVCDNGYDGDVCQYKRMDCDEGYVYSEGQCVKDTCIATNGHVCAGYGSCMTDSCVCDSGFVLVGTADCTSAVCFVDGEICPHGQCSNLLGTWYCKCNAEYSNFDNRCIPNSCISSVSDFGYPEICSNRGTCDKDKRRCICSTLYKGTYCQKCSDDAMVVEGRCVSFNCISTDVDGEPVICSNQGTCTGFQDAYDPTVLTYICSCKPGYVQIDTSMCVSKKCMSDDVLFKPCNGNGVCDEDECKCNEGFRGELCEDYDCPHGETYVLGWGCTPDECVTEYSDGKRRICSGYGKCVEKGSKHVCECRPDGTLIGNDCVSPQCLTGDGKEVCNGTGACRDGMCV